jgi:hypothetical protein
MPVSSADPASRSIADDHQDEEVRMKIRKTKWRRVLSAAAVAAAVALGMAGLAVGATITVTLSGDQEVPPVRTSATGSGSITIADDGAVSGVIRTTGIAGNAAHIHLGAPGKAGPVAVPLVKGTDGSWTFAPDAKLNSAQLAACKAGQLYINVHSTAHPDGEIRGQLKP